MVVLALAWTPRIARAQTLTVEAPEVVLRGLPFSVTATLPSADSVTVRAMTADGTMLVEQRAGGGTAVLKDLTVASAEQLPLEVRAGAASATVSPRLLPGGVTILPPLIAILLALLTHEVVASLFLGVWLGCLFLVGYNPLSALLLTVSRYGRDALANPDHAAIIIFSLLLGGMVGVLTRMGATTAIVEAVRPFATSARRGQFAAWLAGLAIFFDDYSNALIVGNTMRPVTDRLKVSREKLAYIVDSTAAPVSAIVFVSTWVGFEISLIGDGLSIGAASGAAAATISPFGIFLNSVPYLFYPIIALALVAVLIAFKRDFGPMLAAERRAREGGGVFRPGAQLTGGSDDLQAADGVHSRWWTAAVPVLIVVVTVIVGLIHTGRRALPSGGASWREIFGAADPFVPLLWGSLLGCVAAILIAVMGRKLKLQQAIDAWITGIRSMLLAIVILLLAWSLGAVTESLNTATFLSAVLSARLPAGFLPSAVFIVGALVSFATGSSWGTMAILFPLAVPLSLQMGAVADPAAGAAYGLLLATVAAVMGGALFGDHCSPISDTTILSSMASGCDHVDHVRTQLPYALLVAGVAVVLGSIPAGYGVSPWISLAVGLAVMAGVVRYVGQPVDAVPVSG